MTAAVAQAVNGAVINDYGLDNIPFTLVNPATPNSTASQNLVIAFVTWNVAFFTYQSSGKAPTVNVTDSAGNLWRQIGETALNSGSRSAIWACINATQVSWVSVALTGWAYSTSYTIAEISGIPTTMQAIALDYVTINQTTSAVASLAVGTGPGASGSDIAFGLIGVGGQATSFTTPSGWTKPAAFTPVGGSNTFDSTLQAYWIANQTGSVTFTPGWTTSGPASGIIVGLKQVAPAPVQGRVQFPRVIIEAAFGADPGDWTQSVDYTYSSSGIVWTDISTRCIGDDQSSKITISRGRQYELSQEETGEMHITLDNHDGIFTFTNTNSPYYPNCTTGTPLRVTAWWTQPGGIPIQYGVGFGYVERWPQEWPDMPQWGFDEIVCTDAYGPMAAVNLLSCVGGDIRKDYPYAYFPTNEQYSFTTQSLDPVKAPIDANGLIAVNYAFGNNRFAAYRDGTNAPVAVGQALNLLGSQDTTLGVTSYNAQDTNDNGPAMFYVDPNIPVNGASGSGSFSVEFWFVWGYGGEFACTLFSAYGRPSTFWDTTNGPTNGGVISIGINTGGTNTNSGIYVNGTLVAANPDGNFTPFSQGLFNPQHFVLSVGPNGAFCYLNGVLCNQGGVTINPVIGNIPQIKTIVLGPGRSSYENTNQVIYNSYNYVAGHLAWYPQELTPTMITNHYNSGATGFVGVSAPYRFAQILTWGLVGLKRGGVMWTGVHGTAQPTAMSEAYELEGSSIADSLTQIVQSEGGRAWTQGNGSIVYGPRWSLFNPSAAAVFGDNGTYEIPFDQSTSFSVDNQFLFNEINATQNRGPNQDIFYQQTNSSSQLNFFNRSGAQYQSYVMSPFDVYGIVDWNMVKYQNPQQRVDRISVDPAAAQGAITSTFGTILGLELEDTVTVNRRPVGASTNGTFTVTGAIQRLQHEIGPQNWTSTYQIAPRFPENNALVANQAGWTFSTTGTPTNGTYFMVTTAQAATIGLSNAFTDTKNPGTTFTVANLAAPSGGNVQVSFTPAANTVMTSDTVTQVPYNTLGNSYLAW